MQAVATGAGVGAGVGECVGAGVGAGVGEFVGAGVAIGAGAGVAGLSQYFFTGPSHAFASLM